MLKAKVNVSNVVCCRMEGEEARSNDEHSSESETERESVKMPRSSYTERFEFFVTANDIKSDKVVATFLSVVGAKTFSLLRDLIQPNKPSIYSYDEIVKTLNGHFSPKPLLIAERFRFHKRNQEENESVTQYVAVLRKMTEHCQFGTALSDTLRDRLVCGLRSEAIQKRLLTEENLTFKTAVDTAISMELAAKEAVQLGAASRVHKVAATPERQKGDTQECYRCGKRDHPSAECWARELQCRHCNKKGHIERVCRAKREKGPSTSRDKWKPEKGKTDRERSKKKLYAVKQEQPSSGESDSDEEIPVNVLTVKGGSAAYTVTPQLEGQPIPMEIDTGAAVSLMSEKLFMAKLSHTPLTKAKIILKTYTGETVPMAGKADVHVELNGHKATLPIYVVKGDYPALMGRPWLEMMRLDWKAVNVVSTTPTKLSGVLKRHAAVFNDELGNMKGIAVKL